MSDAWERLYRDEQEAVNFLLKEEFGETEMKSKNFQAAKEQSAALLAWAQNLIGSECDIADEQAALQAAWDELQATPAYVERFENKEENIS